MNARDLPRLPGCGRPSTVRIEVFGPVAGADRATLSAVAYGCAAHAGAIEAMLTDAGLRPVRTRYTLTGRTWPCGQLIPFTAPDDAANEADVAAFFAALRVPDPAYALTSTEGTENLPDPQKVPGAGNRHPAWCAQKPNEDGHGTGLVDIGSRDDSVVVEAELWGERNDTGRCVLAVSLRFTEDYKVQTYLLGLDQAETFAAVLAHLVALGRGEQ